MKKNNVGKINASLEELTWKRVRENIAKINPQFAKIVDELDPDENHTIFKAIYPYGSEILNKAILHVPNLARVL